MTSQDRLDDAVKHLRKAIRESQETNKALEEIQKELKEFLDNLSEE